MPVQLHWNFVMTAEEGRGKGEEGGSKEQRDIKFNDDQGLMAMKLGSP